MAAGRPQSVLFACGLNSIRSPMAAALAQWLYGKSVYIGSAGVHKGEPDPFAIAAMEDLFRYDEAAALARTRVPVRLLNADAFPTDLAAARRYKADVELTVMPRVGHFLMAEEPDEFNRLLARAVRELTSAAAPR